MGHRANLVIVRAGVVELFYTHWRASTLPHDLFFGPAHAEAFIRAQRGEADGAGWLDEIWAEGGAVLDLDRRILRLWGGEDLRFDVVERRLFLALMAHPWRGFAIEWAHEGIADQADHVGVPRAQVLCERADDEQGAHDLAPPADPSWVDAVVSARLGDGSLRLFPIACHAQPILVHADAVVAAAARGDGAPALRLALPACGTHVDLVRGTLELWCAADAPEVAARAAAQIPELRVIDHRDRFEAQLDACEGRLAFDVPPEAELLAKIRAALVRPAHDFSGVIPGAIARPLAEGRDVEVNPFALRDDRIDLSLDDKARLVDAAIAAHLAHTPIATP